LQRFGGPARWAAELGVPVIAHRRGAGFADAEVQGVLRNLLRDHHPARFPTLAWLRRNGPPGLAAAVQRSGGTAHWAGMLRMPAPPPAVWTDERIEAELRRVCAGATRWPSKAEFEHAGALGVLGAIYRGHGTHWWAQRIGLQADGLRPRRKHEASGRSAGVMTPQQTTLRTTCHNDRAGASDAALKNAAYGNPIAGHP